jgi:O-antigen/teichoic acid export membrane protein
MAAEPDAGPMTAAAEGAAVLSGPDVAGRVVRGGAQRVVGFAVVNVLGAGSSVILLRYLGVSDFGRYGTVIALVSIASGLADAGLNLTGSRELALLHDPHDRRQLLGGLLGVRLLLLTLAALAAVAFAFLADYDSEMLVGTALAGVGALLVGTQSTLTLPLIVQLRNGLLSINEVLKQVILVVGVVALAIAGASLTAFFAIQVMVGVVALLALPFLADWTQLAWPSLSRADLHHVAFTALPLALAAILTAVYLRLLIVMASLLTSEYETGLFVTSSRVIEMIGGLAMLVAGVILPVATVAARDDRPRLRYMLAATTKLALVSGGLLALTVVVAARPIVVLLGGEDFADAASVLRLQAPVVLTVFLVYLWTGFLIADGRRRALVLCMLGGTAVLIVAGIAFIAPLDAQGGALAAVAADVVLECSGNPRGLASAVRGAARGGRVVMVGLPAPGEQPALISLAITREIDLIGSFRFNDEIDAVLAAFADGSLAVDPVVTHEFPAADALEAFAVAQDPARSGKVLLDFS